MSSISSSAPTQAEPQRPLIRRDDAQRLLQNIIEARTTSHANEFEDCLNHAYFILNSMLESNQTSHRPTNTDIFSEMLRLIDDAREVMYNTIQMDEDGFPSEYVNPRAVSFIIRLNDKYVELINHTTQI